ncbi:hypothetical protein D3C87_744170 [compost metagenome]
METLDLIRGTRSTQVDLAALPYLSRLGPNEGILDIVSDATGKVVDLKVSLVSPRRVLLRELDRLAAEAAWPIPVDEIRGTTTPRFVVDLELGPEGKQRLGDVEIRLDGATLERVGTMLRPLLKDKHYQIVNLREVINH